MVEIKSPMTGAYKAVFIFSIAMVILSFVGGMASHFKGVMGIVTWGSVAWLIYKRKNNELVILFKVLMWFEVILGGVGALSLMYFDVNDVIGFGLSTYLVILISGIAIFYALLTFFQKQITNSLNAVLPKAVHTNNYIPDAAESRCWVQALDEFNSEARNKSLWAKSFAECNGDENKAQAQYLSIRFSQLVTENKTTPSAGNLSTKKDEPKNKGGYGIFFGILLIVGLAIFLIFSLDKPKRFSSYDAKPTSITKSQNEAQLLEENKSQPVVGGWYPVFFDGPSQSNIETIVAQINKGHVANLQIEYDHNLQLAKWVAKQIVTQTSMQPTLFQYSPPDSGTVSYERNRVAVIVRSK